jgi:hypothetical protein
MPKIGPNKVSVDPKAYAARVTRAKKTVAAMDPAMKAKLEQYFPKVSKEDAAKQAIGGRKVSPEQKKMMSTSVKPKPKPAVKTPTKPATKAPAKKSTPLKGPAAVKEIQRQVSPKGIKKTESGAKKAIDKKYPGLYKK